MLLSYVSGFLPFSKCFEGEEVALSLIITAVTTSKQHRIWWVTSMLVGVQALELLPVYTSQFAVYFSKTDSGNRAVVSGWLHQEWCSAELGTCLSELSVNLCFQVFRAFFFARVQDKVLAIPNTTGSY